ncbi:hypothetical protein [Streptomyces mexicanus]|uniref:hypothetical protein n=1 Tax=Streptomyces mexicanus TaxID=178566 RepID=UPI0031EB101A
MTTFREDRAERRAEASGPVTETLPLGRIAGVRVGLHWSVLIIVSLGRFLQITGSLVDVCR